MFDAMTTAMSKQVAKLTWKIFLDHNKVVVNCPALFKPIHFKISHYAIMKTLDQWAQGNKPEADPIGSRTYMASWGIPCHHFLKKLCENKQSLSPEHYHGQWHLDYNPQLEVQVSD